MTKDEALRMALEALEIEDKACAYLRDPTPEHIEKAITAIREVLAQPACKHEWLCGGCLKCGQSIEQPEPAVQGEPVAWAENDGDGNVLWDRESCFSDDPEWLDNPIPLYTTPQPAVPERKPLTLWTEAQHERAYRNSPELHKDVKSLAAFKRVAKEIAAMYGITGESK